MADTQLNSMTENTAPDSADLLYLLDDPGGSPADNKMTILTLKSVVASYAFQFSSASFGPVDATTYYLGAQPTVTPGVVASGRRIYIPRAGTVTSVYIVFTGTTGSSETSTVSFRLNNTTDTTISSSVDLSASPAVYSNTALSIAVAAGDYFEIKWVTPTWVTNPTGTLIHGVVFIA